MLYVAGSVVGFALTFRVEVEPEKLGVSVGKVNPHVELLGQEPNVRPAAGIPMDDDPVTSDRVIL
jgi:hypothetical protein